MGNIGRKIITLSILWGIGIFCYAQNDISTLPNYTLEIRGDQSFPPYEFINAQGEPDGFNVELFRALAKELGLSYNLKLDNWHRVQNQLKNCEIDATIGMMYSSQRAQYAIFGIPHCIIYQAYACRKNNNFKAFDDLKGKEIIVQNGDISHEYLKEINMTDKIILVEDIKVGLKMLESGKYDAVFFEEIPLMYYSEQEKMNDLVIHKADFEPQQYSLTTNIKNNDLLYHLNKALYQLKTNGTYDQIHNKWFGKYTNQDNTRRYKQIFTILISIIALSVIFILALRIRINKATLSLKKSNEDSLNLIRELKAENETRMKIEKELTQSEHKFREIYDSANDAIFVYNSESLELLSYNERVRKIYGFSDEEWNNIEFIKRYFTINPHINQRRYYLVKNNNGKVFEYQSMKYNGNDLWLEIGIKERNINDQPCHIVLVRDINERKEVEHELIQAKEKAEESDHLKTSFLANLSHEIRTPLNSIMGFASLLPEEEDSALISKYSQIIVDNSEQLVSMIDEILLYSKLETHLIQARNDQFKIVDLFNSIFMSFNLPIYQGDVKLYIDSVYDPELSICTDHERIRQIFMNLISNAFKYTEKGQITFGYKIENGKIVFYVKDTGFGIPEKETATIFDRFTRGSNIEKTNIRGTGLGLCIVKELVTLLGGNIWVESKLGVGSCFYFTIANR